MSRESEYWAGRFAQLEEASHRDAGETMGFIDEAYKRAEGEVEKQLDRWYQRFADNNGIVDMAAARQLLHSGELKEFRWTLEEYAQRARETGHGADWSRELENASAKWHVTRLEALKLNIQQSVEVLYGNQLDAMDAMMRQSYLGRYYHTAHLVQTGAGVGWDIAALNNRALKIAVSQPWSLDGRNFSDRIWTHKAELLAELRTNLTVSLLTDNTCEKTVKALMKRFGVDRNKAERLVYTENAYMQAVAQGDAYRETGVKKYQFIATLDDRTSDICRATDGQVFDVAEYQPGETAPPLHPWCRSATCPYYDKLAEVGERAARNPETGKTYFVPRNMTYADWEKTFVKGGSKEGLTLKSEGGKISVEAAAALVPHAHVLQTSGASVDWSKATFTEAHPLEEHWEKHKSEFPDMTMDEYLQEARSLLQRPLEEGALEEIPRSDGSIERYYFPKNYLVGTSNDGHIRTFFRPKEKEVYWKNEYTRNKP